VRERGPLASVNARLEGTLAAAEAGTWTFDLATGTGFGDATRRACSA
jgi:hypothetical protein